MKTVEKVSDVFRGQEPDTKRPHIGVEIEFCSVLTSKAIAESILKMRWAPHVTLSDDGSVSGSRFARFRGMPYDYGHELQVLLPAAGFEPILRQIVAWLVSIGAYVNSTCGLHVHLDCRHRNDIRVWRRLKASQELLYSLVHPRRRKSIYCKPVPERCKTPGWQHGYRGLELGREIDTVEVRMHEGTLDADRMVNWVNLLQGLAKGQKEGRVAA